MTYIQLIFWVAFAIVFYSFIGYGIILYILVFFKKRFGKINKPAAFFQPEVTLVVPCYNEADIIAEKIANSLQLDYPADKLKLVFITDGSTDNSAEVLEAYPNIEHLHIARRGGKTAAENRAMEHISTPYVIFSDANTLVNTDAVKNMIRHFANPKVGCVAGEKRIMTLKSAVASAAGEGIYWKYESFLKKLDSELYSAVGAAGELVAFKTDLYEKMPEDTILDDFIQSMLIASKGYKIIYEPEAYAMETAAASVKEELKRKVRICAGGWQSIVTLSGRLKATKYPTLYFQYISHRVLRWTVNPLLLIIMLTVSFQLAFTSKVYLVLFAAQTCFYLVACMGYILETKKLRVKALFVPYYFCIMNYAVVAGFIRHIKGSQSAVWEKNNRLASA